MARIYCYGPLGAGHVNPMLGIVAELVARGHDVTFWAPRMFSDRIAETGAGYRPVVSTWESMSGGPPQMHGKEFVRAMGLLLTETQALVPRLFEETSRAGEPPDVVLHDGTLAWWGRVLAHRWQVPSVETWPNFVGNEHWSMKDYSRLNLLSPRLWAFFVKVARYLRSEGITDIEGFTRGDQAAQRLVTLPRALQYAGDTFTDRYAFVGPCLTARTFQGDWQPPADGRRVLLVSLGTAYNDRPDLYRGIIDSAAEQPWHTVLSVGDQVDRDLLPPAPTNVEVHSTVPQLRVLEHASVFVTHAGMGSVLEALAAEVPLVAVPQMAEQQANADRIAQLGLGRRLASDDPDPAQLWHAVAAVTDDPQIQERLARMRREIDAAGGSVAAADAVEHALP